MTRATGRGGQGGQPGAPGVGVSTDRLTEIADLVARCRKRLDSERAFALLKACEELLRAVPRQERLL